MHCFVGHLQLVIVYSNENFINMAYWCKQNSAEFAKNVQTISLCIFPTFLVSEETYPEYFKPVQVQKPVQVWNT